MKKSRIVVDPNNPLPSGLSKEWEETFAKLILETYFPKTFSNLSVEGESPDLCNEYTDVGIEVTNAEDAESRQLDSLYTRKYLHGDCRQRQQAAKRISELHGEIKDFFLLHPVKNRSLDRIYQAIQDKTTKLNQNYRIFARNFLFVFAIDSIENGELPEMLYKIRGNAYAEEHYFTAVFVYCFGGDLYEFDLKQMIARKIDTVDNDINILSHRARNIIEEKYR